MENEIYRVVRRTTGRSVRLTLQDHPTLSVMAKSQSEAEEALLDEIAERFGDGEPVLDYVERAAPSRRATWWVFRSNEEVVTENLPELFTEGVCGRCGVGVGERKSRVARKVLGKIKGDVAFTFSGPVMTHVLSKSITEILIETGLSRADLAPVLDENGSEFFEVTAKGAKVEWVPVKPRLGVKVGAQKCPRCAFTAFGFVHVKDKDVRRFIAETDEPRMGGVTCIVGSNKPEPVLSSVAQEMIRSRKDLRGFIWGRVGLAKPADVETKLKLDLFPKP